MKRFSILTAAALAVGGMTFVGCDDEKTDSRTVPNETAG
jgi:hypothetical protein